VSERELCDCRRCLIEVGGVAHTDELIELTRGNKDFSSNIIAVLFHRVIRVRATHAGLSEPQMHKFMQGGERPGSPCVLVIDHNHGRNRVCKREAAKNLHRNAGMVTPKIPQQEDEHASSLDPCPQVRECVVSSLHPTKVRVGES
jgi:hypothetical protein